MPAFTTAWRWRTSVKYSVGMSIWVKTSRSGSQVMVVPVFFRSAGATCISPTRLPFSKWRSYRLPSRRTVTSMKAEAYWVAQAPRPLRPWAYS